jgi:hypothetical protein
MGTWFSDGVAVVILGCLASLIVTFSRESCIQRQRDTIVRGLPAEYSGKAPLKPLTPDEKIGALYALSKRQGRFHFVSNLAWVVFGIVGGYLARHFLPH